MIPTKRFVFRFSDVEVNEQELRARRGGEALDLEPKAFRVLVYLIKHAGHLVTKSELIEAVWGETAVTDNSLTRVIALLRRVLEDDPRQPKFIETVSTAGYRFICPVESEESSVSSRDPGAVPLSDAVKTEAPVQTATIRDRTASLRHRWSWALIVGAFIVVLSFAAVLWYGSRPLPPPHIGDIAQITNDPRYIAKGIAGTDGARLYLNLYGVPNSFGEVPVTGGDVSMIPMRDSGNVGPLSPDGMSFIVQGNSDPKDQLREIWIVGASGSPARLLTRGVAAAWSADGKQVIYANSKGEIYTIPSSGGEPHLIRVLGGPDLPSNFAYSPDGSKVRFFWGLHRLMEMAPDGSNLHEILAGWHTIDLKCCGFWAPDGSFFLFFSAGTSEVAGFPGYQIWAVDERHGWLRRVPKQPMQLTFGPMTWLDWATFIPDGRKIFANGETWRGELVRYDRQTKQLEPFMEGISADMLDFSRDGQYVLYAPFPGVTISRANRNGTDVQQIATISDHPINPRWSPGGDQIAFAYSDRDGRNSTYVVSAKGGTPVRVLPDNKCCEEVDPTWSPDGKQLALWVRSPEGRRRTN